MSKDVTPREWWIDINEWIGETGQSGMAFNQAALDDMEIGPGKMIHVIEYSAYESVLEEYKNFLKCIANCHYGTEPEAWAMAEARLAELTKKDV